MKNTKHRNLVILFFILVLTVSCATKKEELTLDELLAGFEVGDPGSGTESKILLMAYKGSKKDHKKIKFTLNFEKKVKDLTLISVFSFKHSSQYKDYASEIFKDPQFPKVIDVSLSPKLFKNKKLNISIQFEFGIFKRTDKGLKKVNEEVIKLEKGATVKDDYLVFFPPKKT